MDALDVLFVFLMLFFVDRTVSMSANIPKKKISHNIHLKMNDIELRRYFGVTSLSNVPEYDIAFPGHVDKRGRQISSNHAKREIELENGSKYYHLNAFNKNLHLKVSLNKHLLGPDFHVETRHKDGSKTITDAPHRNFYHGHVLDHPRSFVALSDYNGVSGAIRLVDDEILYMEPVPHHLLQHVHRTDEHLPHFVVKKTEKDFQKENKIMFDSEEIHHRNEAPLLRKELQNSEEIDDDENGHRFYEILYVGDHLIAQEIGLMELPDMLLIIANIVSRMYTDSSFGKIKLHYVVTKVLILNNGELKYTRDASNRDKFNHFDTWLAYHNPESDADPQHVDAGTLFTSYTEGGLARMNGMCIRDMAAVVGHIGLGSSEIAAHENFHNLGGYHDGNDECPDGDHLMATHVSVGKASFTWSNCSRRWVQFYLRYSLVCLNDAPTINLPAIPSYIKHNLPGTIFDGNKQCQYVFGNPAAQQCVLSCRRLYCSTGSGSCWSKSGAPADGTLCFKNKWCIRGECVDNGSPPINGNWGSWSKYSDCSRTCGVGIQHRTRKCNNPSPRRGGKPCLEPSKTREDRTCNVHACPSDSQPFRKKQCQSFNANYTSYVLSTAGCRALWCRRISSFEAKFGGWVIDGTRCYGDNDSKQDVCVNSKCKRFGCDKQLNGDEFDRCGVCAGNGSTCELRITNYTAKLHSNWGVWSPHTMLILKKGYRNVHVKMNGANANTIGVQDMNGRFVIKIPSRTTTKERSGMKITYIHERYKYRDEIIIPGLITEDLKLVFISFRERNEGVVIRYLVPVKNPVKPSSDIFYWKTSKWSTCSKTCAGGISTRDVLCFRNDDNTRVGILNCQQDIKPATEQACNAQDCPAEWYPHFTACTTTCGKGTQSHKIECRRLTTDRYRVVDDSECTEPRPTARKPSLVYCNEIACPPVYKPEPWSKCSKTCGQGIMTRSLKCQMINDQGGITSLPLHICEQYKIAKLPTKENCNFDIPCVAKPNYSPLGCFKDDRTNRTLPRYLKNLRPKIDWKNIKATVEACAKLAKEHNVVYFGIQYYGKCRAAKSGTVPDYDKYGPANNCWRGVGGRWSNYVYKMITG